MSQRTTGISNRETPEQEAHERAEHPQVSPDAPPDGPAVDEDMPDAQTSNKTGVKSLAQKSDRSKYVDDAAPPVRKKAGAFGKEGGGAGEP